MLRGYVRLRVFHIMTDMSLPQHCQLRIGRDILVLTGLLVLVATVFLEFLAFFYESFLGGFNLFIRQLTVINLIKNPFTWRYDDSVCRI